MNNNTEEFNNRIRKLISDQEAFLRRSNSIASGNGICNRYERPVITRYHSPIHWIYDLNEKSNPYLMQRLAVNATFNAGAILFEGKYLVVVRVEGADRKSFFAIAQSPNGIDNFRFWDYPVHLDQAEEDDTNVYDMRLVHHEDGWIYGLFCTERKDHTQPNDMSAATAQCGIVRTKDLVEWERLPDLKTRSDQQRNVVLHPEFVNGKYALYTRPQDGFITVGGGGGIGWGLCDDMTKAIIDKEIIVDNKVYHTIKELKNGQGPAPLKTEKGWLHLAHGVRNTAAGLRYVLYMFMTDLAEPWRVIYSPGGHFLAPEGDERIGDVSNVVFSNGWIKNEKDEVFIYYASSDTRLHVATTAINRLLDYCINTPPDLLTSAGSVQTRSALISSNLEVLKKL